MLKIRINLLKNRTRSKKFAGKGRNAEESDRGEKGSNYQRLAKYLLAIDRETSGVMLVQFAGPF